MYYSVTVTWVHSVARINNSSLGHNILLGANSDDHLHKNEPIPFLVETYITNDIIARLLSTLNIDTLMYGIVQLFRRIHNTKCTRQF